MQKADVGRANDVGSRLGYQLRNGRRVIIVPAYIPK